MFNKLLVLAMLMISVTLSVYSQDSIHIDKRDGKQYRTVVINSTTWMKDNLNYITELSREPSDSLRKAHDLEGVTGRYYHFQELSDVCPEGWKISSYENWIEYFQYVNEKRSEPVDLKIIVVDNESESFHRYITGYQQKIDFFEEGNPLALYPVSRFQGENVSSNPDNPFADYWVYDPEAEYKGRTHIHIFDEFIPIHSHEHHMDPEEVDKLRRFMVRCVKD